MSARRVVIFVALLSGCATTSPPQGDTTAALLRGIERIARYEDFGDAKIVANSLRVVVTPDTSAPKDATSATRYLPVNASIAPIREMTITPGSLNANVRLLPARDTCVRSQDMERAFGMKPEPYAVVSDVHHWGADHHLSIDRQVRESGYVSYLLSERNVIVAVIASGFGPDECARTLHVQYPPVPAEHHRQRLKKAQ